MSILPKVSVILPVYNGEKYLEEAIDSVLSQTFEDFELLIINDGSTDQSEQIIKRNKEKDKRVVYLQNEGNKGLIYTLNRGIEEAKGEFIARMDADDISLPERFAKQVAYLEEHPEIIVLGGNYEIFGNKTGRSKLKLTSQEIELQLYFKNAMAHPTVMIRSNVFENEELRYDQRFIHMEDWALWLAMKPFGRFANLNDCVLKYRMEGQNISEQNADTLKERAEGLYSIYLKDIYNRPVTKSDIEVHWKIVQVNYTGEKAGVILGWLNNLETSLKANTSFETDIISQFILEKKIQFFYLIADSSRWKGVSFLFQIKELKLSYFRYILASIFSSSKRKG